MVGIVSYGAYIPKYRIDRKIIYKAMGWFDASTYLPGEKAVASFDEDSVTMAVNSMMDCLTDFDRTSVDALYFASTSAPYKERLSSEMIATACDLGSEIRSADFSNSVKAGTTALLSALDAAKSGTADNIAVCASDCRLANPGSAQEELFGDGAASLIIGNEGVLARLEGSHSVSYDLVDYWRSAYERTGHQWEDRFIRTEGYVKFIMETISGVAKKCNIEMKDVAKVAFPSLYAGDHRKIGKMLGLSPEQVQDPMVSNIGYTGTSNPLMLLVAALEDAKPGDKIVVAGFGSGSDALLFQVTDEINNLKGPKKGIRRNLAAKRELTSYEKMLSFRDTIPVEKGIRGKTATAFTSFSTIYRSREVIMGLCGSKCKACGTPQFPAQQVCVNPECGAINQMEKYRFSDRKAKLFTYTGDNLAYTPCPPTMYGVVDFEGGGRFWFDLVEADLESLKVGMEVEFTFRKKYSVEDFGQHIYCWKMMPVME